MTAISESDAMALQVTDVTKHYDSGFTLDDEANAVRSKEPRVISAAGSAVTVLVVPTNEELAMARETKATVGA